MGGAEEGAADVRGSGGSDAEFATEEGGELTDEFVNSVSAAATAVGPVC